MFIKFQPDYRIADINLYTRRFNLSFHKMKSQCLNQACSYIQKALKHAVTESKGKVFPLYLIKQRAIKSNGEEEV